MSRKKQNIKEFIKYMEKTVDLFDGKVPSKDFEDENSEVYKLCKTLFAAYIGDEGKHSNYIFHGSDSEQSDAASIVAKQIRKSRRDKKNKNGVMWENKREIEESDKEVLEMFKNRIRDLRTEEGPILFTDNNALEKNDIPEEWRKLDSKNNHDALENIDEKDSSYVDLSESEQKDTIKKTRSKKSIEKNYEKTDDISQKLNKLKKMLKDEN